MEASGQSVQGSCAVTAGTGGKYGSLRYVDNLGDNFLFRGPVPTISTPGQMPVYDYDGLTAALRDATPPSLMLPAQYMLLDVCLLHANEGPEVTTIVNFFADNQGLGSVSLTDTYGTPVCYFQQSPQQQQQLIATFDQWLPEPLVWRVATIRQSLEQSPFGVPVIVYVHCDGGCDRTAEVIGAYRLRYQGATWDDVYQEQPCGRPLGCDNYRALQWYAFWLNATLGYSLSGIGIDGGCTDPGGTFRECSPPL